MTRTAARNPISLLRRAFLMPVVVTLFLLVLPSEALGASRTISGFVKNGSAVAISGVTMTLSGAASATTTTDVNGFYTFTGSSGSNYTVTPSKTNYTFSPVNRSYTPLPNANQTNQDFTGTLATYTISGHIQNASSISIVGATVSLSGGQTGSTTTDASGNYSFAALPAGSNYTVTPTKINYTFSAASLTYNNLIANQTTADFTGTSTITYTISGHIQNASAVAISGVTVTLSGGQSDSTTTDASGNYSFAGLPSTNNYTVTPTKTNYTFSAASLTYDDLGANQTTADFTGTSTITYTISGHIQTAGATAIVGVTVTLSGGQAGSTTTDESGNYSFASLPSTNNYTVTPSLTNYTFSEASLTYNNLAAAQPAANFTGIPSYTISGHIQNASAVAISGVTVTLSGAESDSTSTDASGNYSFAGLPEGGNYTVTPTKTNYTFASTSLTYNNLGANEITAHFTGTSTITYTVSGNIKDGDFNNLSNVTVVLSGGQSGSTTTDASGNYSFSGLPSTNNYTVTPSKTHYTFVSSSRTYSNLSSNQGGANFTGSLIYHTISGHIQDGSGNPIEGVSVDATFESQSVSTASDAYGNYTINLGAGFNYTVTPWKIGYAFSPTNLTYNDLSSNQTTAHFTGTLTNYTISGHIQTSGGAAISGVTITLSGYQSGSTTTDASGNYSLSAPSYGTATVTPSKSGYTFSPASRTYNYLSANQTTADFTGTPQYTISGHIQNASGVAIIGVTVSLTGGQTRSTTTNASGNYSFSNVPAGNNYTVTPSKTNYTFSSTSVTYNNLSANQTATNFTGTSTITYTISGHIENASAEAISGVTVTLSGGQASSTTTDASGNYSFAGLPSTNHYTVTPAKTSYTFSPASLTYNNLSANQTTANFTGTLVTYTISGHIQDGDSVAISGVTVTLSGDQSGSTTTDASGNYSFAGLPSTNNYTVTPILTNYTFSAASLTYNNLSANQATANFTGTLMTLVPNVTLTASVSPTGPVPPGTDLVYTIDFSNDGAGPATSFVIIDPIPANTDFKLDSATTPSLGTTGLTVTVAYLTVSDTSWTYTPLSGAGLAPAGYDRLVTHVRWSFNGSLSPTSPNNTGVVYLTARIR